MGKKRIKKMLIKIFRIPVCIFRVFPIKHNRIVFQSFKGNDYSDSCKAIIDYMHAFYPGCYDMYWVATDIANLQLPDYEELHCVRKKSLKYFYICMTAQVAICNDSQEASLPLKKNQKIVNTWHGMPYKTVGLAKENCSHIPNYNTYNLFLSPCKFFTDNVIRKSFQYNGPILECGLPRNDILFHQNGGKLKAEIYDRYHLNENVQTVLFAPTFRGDHEDVDIHLNFANVIRALEKRFGGEWVLLYRAHPMLVRKRKNLEGAVDVTFYPDIMELLLVSQVLVTDYSSSMWDFALTGKPVFLFAPDIEDYIKDRGLYVDMEKLPFQLGHDNQELINKIIEYKDESYRSDLEDYFRVMGSFEQGNACEKLAAEIVRWSK